MKKYAFVIAFFSICIVAFLLFNFAKNKIGNIAPSMFPTNENLAEKILESQKTGEKPNIPISIPQGFSIGVFTTNVIGARDLQFSPNGTLLVSLTSQGKVVALPDKNNDGVADERREILSGLRKPHGLAFYNGKLFIAEETKVSRYNFDEVALTATLDKKLFDLPAGGRHFTRSIVFDSQGSLYVSLGSTCDTCIEKEKFISTVLVSDSEGKPPRIYSSGLRNAVFLAIKPNTNEIWTTEMGRDFLGDESPPDEINVLKDSGNFGWPFCFGQKITDTSQRQPNQSFCRQTIAPIYEIPAHSAPLGLVFIDSQQFDQSMQGDLLVAYHGSWNRSTPAGYKIVRISFDGAPKEEDFISGFLKGSSALGRPVDLTFDKAGSLFISDDKANAVYKLVKN